MKFFKLIKRWELDIFQHHLRSNHIQIVKNLLFFKAVNTVDEKVSKVAMVCNKCIDLFNCLHHFIDQLAAASL